MRSIVCILAFTAFAMAGDTDLQKLLRDSNDQFTARMFTEVVKANPNKNVVLSAFSVLPPLGQLALASVDESKDELLRAINLPNDNVTKEVFADYNRGLRSVKGVELKMASKIYVANGYELNEQFESVSRQYFNSEVKQVDFTKNAEAASEINTWVEQQTNDRIKDLVSPDSLGGDTRSVLVNAIYFKGSWKDKFNKERTTERDFHVSNGKTIKVPTMSGKRDVRYGESAELDAKLVELPYEGDEATMLVVLPNAIDGISALEEKLKDPKALQRAEEQMYSTEVELYLPKFKIETTTNLKDVLTNMGVKRLFTPGQAKLDNLLKSNEPLYVSEAVQKAFIEVSEEGAEAAAANAFQIVPASLIIYPQVRIDRPFYYELKTGGMPIFNGKVFQP